MYSRRNYEYKLYLEDTKIKILNYLLDLDYNVICCPYLISKVDSLRQRSFSEEDLEAYAESLNDIINLIDCKLTREDFINNKQKIINLELSLSREVKLERICQ